MILVALSLLALVICCIDPTSPIRIEKPERKDSEDDYEYVPPRPVTYKRVRRANGDANRRMSLDAEHRRRLRRIERQVSTEMGHETADVVDLSSMKKSWAIPNYANGAQTDDEYKIRLVQ